MRLNSQFQRQPKRGSVCRGEFDANPVPSAHITGCGSSIATMAENGGRTLRVDLPHDPSCAEMRIDCTFTKLAPILQPANCPSH